jgi:hypothetical protein
MTMCMVEVRSDAPTGYTYNFLVLGFHAVEALESRVPDPESTITGVVRIPDDLIEFSRDLIATYPTPQETP